MSSKPRKPRSTQAAKEAVVVEEAPAQKVQEVRPKGVIPKALVAARHEGEMISRLGRGFSLGELGASQLPFRLARRWGLSLDLRRRTVLDGNVALIKGWWSGPKQAKREGEVKKLEGELAKVEKAVEKEVKKEAAKAKKEVRKVEKEVVEEVEKPLKKRPRKKTPSKKSK
jgi:ribosomal protein L13E